MSYQYQSGAKKRKRSQKEKEFLSKIQSTRQFLIGSNQILVPLQATLVVVLLVPVALLSLLHLYMIQKPYMHRQLPSLGHEKVQKQTMLLLVPVLLLLQQSMLT